MRLLLDEVDGGEVISVEHRYLKIVAFSIVRNDVIAPRDRFGDETKRLEIDLGFLEIDKGDAEDIGVTSTQFIFVDIALSYQNFTNSVAGFLRFAFCGIKSLFGDQSCVEQEFLKVFCGDKHTRLVKFQLAQR